MDELNLSDIEESEWIVPDMESTFILVETSAYSTIDDRCVSRKDAEKVFSFLEDSGSHPIAIVPLQANQKPVLLTTLGYEAKAFSHSGIADILFVVDLGSTYDMDHLSIVKEAQEQDWIDIEDVFEIQSKEFTLVTEVLGSPVWGKCTLTASPGKYRVRYTLYSEDGPVLLFVRLDLIQD